MNRRAFVTSVAAALASLPLAHSSGIDAQAQGTKRFSRIVVDMAPLEARGARGAAAVIRPQLQAALNRAFAGRIGGGGPVLVVRVQTVQLSSSLQNGGRFGGGPSSDYLEADVTAGAHRFPLLVTQDATAGGPWYLLDNEPRRLRALADSLASWVSRRA